MLYCMLPNQLLVSKYSFRLELPIGVKLHGIFLWLHRISCSSSIQVSLNNSNLVFCWISEGEFDDIQDDTKTSEKATALHLALSQLVGDFGKESMLSLQRFFGARRRAPVLPTGSLRLDLALGIGGLPKVILYKVITLDVLISKCGFCLRYRLHKWGLHVVLMCCSLNFESQTSNGWFSVFLYVQRAMNVWSLEAFYLLGFAIFFCQTLVSFVRRGLGQYSVYLS